MTETILFPVPHRHITFAIPKMLRPYFRFDRNLLKNLCRIAHECLLEHLRTTLDLPDGLFHRSGLFYVLPDVSLKPLEELFRARVITFLVDKALPPPERATMLRGWVHSGFNVHRSRRELPDEREDLERLAQYIIRNPFAVEKMQVGAPIPNRSTCPPKLWRRRMSDANR